SLPRAVRRLDRGPQQRKLQEGIGACAAISLAGGDAARFGAAPDRPPDARERTAFHRRLPASPAPLRTGRLTLSGRRASRIRLPLRPGHRRQRAVLFVLGALA